VVALITERIVAFQDREVVRRACMALINLALNYTHEETIFKSGILPKLLGMLGDKKDRDLVILTSKILVNLTTNDRIRKVLSEMGALSSAVQMMSVADPEIKFQGAKLVANLVISGSNRKAMHDKGMISTLKQVANSAADDNHLKSQIEMALDNCSFPYEQRYEDLNFGLEEKMPQIAEESDEEEEDEDEEGVGEEDEEAKLQEEIARKEEEEKNGQRQLEQQRALEEQKKKLEEEKRLLELRDEEDRKRKEEEEKQRVLELEKQKAKEKEIKEEEERKKKEIEEERLGKESMVSRRKNSRRRKGYWS